MALTRFNVSEFSTWSPFRQLSTLRNEIDHLFESPLNLLTSSSQQFLSGWLPAIDLYEDNDHFTLKAEIPGMRKEDIDISLHGDLLSLSGERKEDEQLAKTQVYRAERNLGRFHRTFTLPVPVAADKVQATYKDGILAVTLPKAEEAKPRQINVNVE
jgi:HSP20 family protein